MQCLGCSKISCFKSADIFVNYLSTRAAVTPSSASNQSAKGEFPASLNSLISKVVSMVFLLCVYFSYLFLSFLDCFAPGIGRAHSSFNSGTAGHGSGVKGRSHSFNSNI
jgi:hypothetical protein